MFERNYWYYPQNATRAFGTELQRSIDGLIRAERVLASIPGEEISFASLQEDKDALPAALRRLYPGAELKPMSHMNAAFEDRVRHIARRRNAPGYRWLAERVEEMRFDAANGVIEVRFGAAERGRLWLWRGWSWGEPWGTWNDSIETEMVVPLARPVLRELQLELRGVAHIVRGYCPRQRIQVSLKGKIVANAEFVRHENNTLAIRVPAEMLAGDDAAVFNIEFPDAVPPPPQHAPGETRKLAFALTSATLSY
jgi:hypothetical protein